MTILLIVLAVALLAAFVVHLVRTVDPDRIGSAPFGNAQFGKAQFGNARFSNALFGSDRESRRHPDRDDDRITCELSAIRSHATEH